MLKISGMIQAKVPFHFKSFIGRTLVTSSVVFAFLHRYMFCIEFVEDIAENNILGSQVNVISNPKWLW